MAKFFPYNARRRSGAALLACLALSAIRPLAARERQRLNSSGVGSAAGVPAVWAQATVIVCADVAYNVTDIFGLYAHDVLGYDEVAAARIGALTFWARPLAALCAGFLADQIGSASCRERVCQSV